MIASCLYDAACRERDQLREAVDRYREAAENASAGRDALAKHLVTLQGEIDRARMSRDCFASELTKLQEVHRSQREQLQAALKLKEERITDLLRIEVLRDELLDHNGKLTRRIFELTAERDQLEGLKARNAELTKSRDNWMAEAIRLRYVHPKDIRRITIQYADGWDTVVLGKPD